MNGPAAPRGPADERWGELVHGLLDGALDDAQCAELGAAVARDPARARELARAASLHDALERELNAGQLGRRSATHTRSARRAAGWLAAAAMVAALFTLLWNVTTAPSARGAQAELRRIASSQPALDRTYVIRAVPDDERPRRKGPRPQPEPPRTGKAQPGIDGALLYLRGDASYVLVRREADGSQLISGSDGQSAWSVPAEGRVRVSADPARFRGALPGQQHGLPFVDPRGGLDALASSYDLVQLDPDEVGERLVGCIVAARRPDVERGPREVTLWYDLESARILRLRLERLPQAHDGPRAVELELLEERDLPEGFFQHEYHHGPEREILLSD